MNIAIITASWHRELLDLAKSACIARLKDLGLNPDHNIEEFTVPGGFEIPLLAKKLAKSGKYDGIIAIGLITDGGIYRHEFVATAVIDGLMRVQLDTEIPVFSCVLTPHHFHEHADHTKFFSQHLTMKGTEVAESAFSFVSQLSQFKEEI